MHGRRVCSLAAQNDELLALRTQITINRQHPNVTRWCTWAS
jgi:hypothetical protein